MRFGLITFVFLLLLSSGLYAQDQKKVVEKIVKEATENSQLEKLAYELTDLI